MQLMHHNVELQPRASGNQCNNCDITRASRRLSASEVAPAADDDSDDDNDGDDADAQST